MSESATSASGRIEAFDGIRGTAYILIIMAHGWTLFPYERIENTPAIAWMFVNGGLAVSIFLIFGGYFAARSLLVDIEYTTPRLTGAWLGRRLVRVSVAVYLLLAAVLVVTYFEEPRPYTSSQTTNSVVSVATHTWNWFLIDDPLGARSDLGHLWYVSVYVQVLIMLAVIFYILRRHLRVLTVVLVIAIIAVTIWRADVVANEPLATALLKTTTRMDGVLWGALLAILMPHLHRVRPYARIIASAAAIAIVVLWITGSGVNYFQLHGAVFNAAVVALMIGISYAPPGFGLSRALGSVPLRTIGRRSLTIYVWHYTLFWTISRHTQDWHWAERTVIALALLAIIVEVVHRRVDEPLRRWLEVNLVSRPPTESVKS